jgi:hypothetical protein
MPNVSPGRQVLVHVNGEFITGSGAIVDDLGAGNLLDLASDRFGRDGLLLLGDVEWDKLKSSAGWVVGTEPRRAWITASRCGRYIRIGRLSGIDRRNDPLMFDNLITTAVLHGLFHDLTGVPFYADGGTTSGLLMDATITARDRTVLRKWTDPLAPHVNEPWTLGPWGDEDAGGITIDRNAQHLAAAGTAILPADALERNGDGTPVLLKIRVPEAPCPHLPHPCGPKAEPGSLRWVAHPTLTLLDETGCKVQVQETWTAPRMLRLLRGKGRWYDTLRDARAAVLDGDDPDTRAVRQAIKDTYTRGIGATLARDNGRWYRPDWRAIIFATARANLWRSMLKVGLTDGLWPLYTDTDSVMYESAPDSLRYGTGLGEWK